MTYIYFILNIVISIVAPLLIASILYIFFISVISFFQKRLKVVSNFLKIAGVTSSWTLFLLIGLYSYNIYLHYSELFSYGWIVYIICLSALIFLAKIFLNEISNMENQMMEKLHSGDYDKEAMFQLQYFSWSNRPMFLIFISYIVYSIFNVKLFAGLFSSIIF